MQTSKEKGCVFVHVNSYLQWLQDLKRNESIVQLNKDPTHEISLDSLHEGDLGDAMTDKTFVSHMRTFHYKMERSFLHD